MLLFIKKKTQRDEFFNPCSIVISDLQYPVTVEIIIAIGIAIS